MLCGMILDLAFTNIIFSLHSAFFHLRDILRVCTFWLQFYFDALNKELHVLLLQSKWRKEQRCRVVDVLSCRWLNS